MGTLVFSTTYNWLVKIVLNTAGKVLIIKIPISRFKMYQSTLFIVVKVGFELGSCWEPNHI